ncbi:MAG TPA: hypothetical protein VEA16_03730 [Vicinamibacterales bacterium]|nr:hypothetical protein [Vicinamibacterales bacterium]
MALTWPVVLGLGRDVPGDLGDSLLNMWILAWGAEHIPRLLTGQIGWADFWNANIFHPDPLALALSEHLVGLSVLILPVYWLSGNIILCYNLLFVSTFALSAFGTYLLVRDLTGDKRAAFIAGVVYGFLPYRIASVPHLQVMSSQWMPLALWGLNRFVTRIPEPGARNRAYVALILGSAALVMQNWSCGYYLLYFAPFVPVFLVHRMWTAGTLRNKGTWAGLLAGATSTVLLTLPFLFPYAEAQQQFGFQRSLGEVVLYSANVWSYVTASENLSLFGTLLRFYPHGEGETFLGFTPWVLAFVAIGALTYRGTASPVPSQGESVAKRILTMLLAFAAVSQLIALLSVVMFGGFEVGPIRARTPQRLLVQFVAALALLLAISARARVESMRIVRSPIFAATALTIVAMWLSLGPLPKAGTALVSGFGLYGVLYDYVPGFNGVRVPARYAMIAGLFLAVLAGYGARTLLATATSRPSQAVVVILIAALALVEGAAVPLEVNRTWQSHEAMPPARVFPYRQAPPVYARVATLPDGSSITEFPFGDGAWEIRYTYYAGAHWKPITNGYSGNFPPKYSERLVRFRNLSKDPEAAWRSLVESQSTHAIVHRGAFANLADADAVESWLKSHGATELERFPDGDVLLTLR